MACGGKTWMLIVLCHNSWRNQYKPLRKFTYHSTTCWGRSTHSRREILSRKSSCEKNCLLDQFIRNIKLETVAPWILTSMKRMTLPLTLSNAHCINTNVFRYYFCLCLDMLLLKQWWLNVVSYWHWQWMFLICLYKVFWHWILLLYVFNECLPDLFNVYCLGLVWFWFTGCLKWSIVFVLVYRLFEVVNWFGFGLQVVWIGHWSFSLILVYSLCELVIWLVMAYRYLKCSFGFGL